MRPAGRADSSAVLLVLNIKVRMEALLSSSSLRLYDLLRESCKYSSIFEIAVNVLTLHTSRATVLHTQMFKTN